MIYTNYVGMVLGGYVVIGYRIDIVNKVIELEVKCMHCGYKKVVKLYGDKLLKIKCNSCGRYDIVVPIEVYEDGIVKDTMTIGDYQYRKLKKLYKDSNIQEGELIFIKRLLTKEMIING